MARVYLLKQFFVEGYGNYGYHTLSADDLVEGRTYYISVYDDMTTDGAMLGSYTHSFYEWSGQIQCGPITIDFGDYYVYIHDDSSPFYNSGVVINFYYEDDESTEPETPSTSVIASITLNARTGIATWSYSANSSDISFYEPYIQLWDPNDMVSSEFQTTNEYYDFSSLMSSGNQYYATLRVEYYDYNTSTSGNVSAQSEVITYSPDSTDSEPDPDEPVTGTSFNARMLAIANAIRSKASVSGTMGIVEMITTLNDLNTIGSTDNSKYDSTDFDSCITKLANVIRAKGNTSAKLTIAQMPAAINALTIYNPILNCEIVYSQNNFTITPPISGYIRGYIALYVEGNSENYDSVYIDTGIVSSYSGTITSPTEATSYLIFDGEFAAYDQAYQYNPMYGKSNSLSVGASGGDEEDSNPDSGETSYDPYIGDPNNEGQYPYTTYCQSCGRAYYYAYQQGTFMSCRVCGGIVEY